MYICIAPLPYGTMPNMVSLALIFAEIGWMNGTRQILRQTDITQLIPLVIHTLWGLLHILE